MKLVQGIPASSGVKLAKAFVYSQNQTFSDLIPDLEGEDAWILFQASVKTVKKELEALKNKMGESEESQIFEAHQMILEDPELQDQIKEKIFSDHQKLKSALSTVFTSFIQMFESMEDEYLRGRAADLKELYAKISRHCAGLDDQRLSHIQEEVILFSEDLYPSQTATLDPKKVLGFVTEHGGKTSHSAILARQMGIPAVLGVHGVMKLVVSGDLVAIDGDLGEIYFDLDEKDVEKIKSKQKVFEEEKKELKKLLPLPTVLKNGKKIILAANLGSDRDLPYLENSGAEGVGLFRTEFLFLESKGLPSEEEQFQVYRKILDANSPHKVVIRTLDIGGDKDLPVLGLKKEENPFLGLRAVRLCLQRKDLFMPQLRALLRASKFGNLAIMIPMISKKEEIVEVKKLMEEAKKELGGEYSYELGVMVEIPSAALCADELASEVDFFSVGTNDLTQYTLACDRLNPDVQYLYDSAHPSVLKLIQMTVEAAHKKSAWVGVCGELAGTPEATEKLIALGVDELSMSPSQILRVKKKLLSL